MVLRKINKEKFEEPEQEESEEMEEEPTLTQQVKKNLSEAKPIKQKPTVVVMKAEEAPRQRMTTVEQDGKTYEVLTIEEALTEILTILRENI